MPDWDSGAIVGCCEGKGGICMAGLVWFRWGEDGAERLLEGKASGGRDLAGEGVRPLSSGGSGVEGGERTRRRRGEWIWRGGEWGIED